MSSKRESKKLLPKPRRDPNALHLSRFGYELDNSDIKRHIALNKAAKSSKALEALRRLNLIRNITKKGSKNKKKMSKDVEYMKKAYSKHKTKKKSK